jgi:peroxiredoxin
MSAHCIFPRRNAFLGSFIAVGLICLGTAQAFAQEALRAGMSAPDWQLNGPTGKTVKFSDFRGKVVILNFSATWCAPCRLEIPYLIELQKRYGDRGLAVIGVSLDEQGPDVVKEFVKQLGVNYPIVIGNEKITEAYGGIEGIPTTFVIDRQGRVVSQHMGYNEKAIFEKEIQPLL